MIEDTVVRPSRKADTDRCVTKYPIPTRDASFKLHMPAGSKFLAVIVQENRPRLCVEIDKTVHSVDRLFYLITDGGVPLGQYLGTFVLNDGERVFHLYDGGED